MLDRIIKQYGVEYSYEPIELDCAILLKELIAMAGIGNKHAQFVRLSISEFLWQMAIRHQYRVEDTKQWLIDLRCQYRKHTYWCGTSTAFIDIRTPYHKQDRIIRRLYVYLENKGYQSHLGIERELLKDLKGSECIVEKGKA